MIPPLSLRRYVDVATSPELHRELDAIFFESSNTKSFDSEVARHAFRERWLGRYLKQDPGFAHLAFAASDVVGYLVGAIDDPARAPRFADLDSFAALSELTRLFPAHLHVNVAPDFRNRGIGGRLIDRFIADAHAAGAPGVHVLTGAGAPNIRFYNRNGFTEVARTGMDDRLVFLGRSLG